MLNYLNTAAGIDNQKSAIAGAKHLSRQILNRQ
jgi:hypothetical protein